MTARASDGQAGFTLLELLVAATLTAMILAMATGGLRFGARAWDRVAAQSEAALEGRALRVFLRALIEDADPIRLREGAREPRALFVGAPDAMVFAAALPGALAPPGPHLVRLAFEPDGDGAANLTLRWKPLGPTRPSFDFGLGDGYERLASGVRGAFRYAGAPDWTDVDPPRRVELRLSPADGAATDGAGAGFGAAPLVAALRRAP